MTDVLTKAQRSYNMSRIRGKNTKPELTLRSLLSKMGTRGYRTHYNLSGRPDIVFVKKRVAVFVDGCFWHRCPKCFVEPTTRKQFWVEKIGGNVKRDRRTNATLRKQGWKVLRFWEHEIRNRPEKAVSRILAQLG
jgi:DNA mismatch endonuclease (patch repair protein)